MLNIKEIAEGGETTTVLCNETVSLWRKGVDPGPCPSRHMFSVILPSTFADEKGSYVCGKLVDSSIVMSAKHETVFTSKFRGTSHGTAWLSSQCRLFHHCNCKQKSNLAPWHWCYVSLHCVELGTPRIMACFVVRSPHRSYIILALVQAYRYPFRWHRHPLSRGFKSLPSGKCTRAKWCHEQLDLRMLFARYPVICTNSIPWFETEEFARSCTSLSLTSFP